MEKSKDKNAVPFGSGDGLEFQKFMKECPALSTEYALIMFRVNRRHFGPINLKKAEYNLNAVKMFRDIEKLLMTRFDKLVSFFYSINLMTFIMIIRQLERDF